LDWAFDNQAIINLKIRKMNFESGKYRVIAPLDPLEGERFVEDTYLYLEEINKLYRWGNLLEKHYIMFFRLKYRFGELETMIT
jgi:hypothetical protein